MGTTFVNMRNFSHKGSGDKSMCTVPDVCKTQVGPAVVPIPYPVMSQVSDLDAGTSSVKMEGNPTSIKGSNHKSCTGDQPGALKGLVSSTCSKTTEFITYSFDVKCDGEGAARGFDMTTMNNKNTIGLVLGSMTGPAIVVDEEPEAWDPEEAPPWVKIIARYDDPWLTPYPAENVKVTVNDTVVVEDATLNEGVGQNTSSFTLDKAKATKDEPGALLVEPEEPGKVIVEIAAAPGIEDEIKKVKDSIEAQLDGAYRGTVEDMKEFQELWDIYGYASIAISGGEGAYSGAASWLSDQADLFESETWVSLGKDISNVTGSAFDYAHDYASDKYKEWLKSVNELSDWADEASENIDNWAWWRKQVDEVVHTIESNVSDAQDQVERHIDNAMDFLEESKDAIQKLTKHQKEIVKLPEYIASGDAVAVQRFVDTVVADIYPDIAAELKASNEFHLVLELINDQDAALTYIAYMQLFFEAVPPNFYAYISGKGGAYVAIEVLLLIALSFLTLGAGTAAKLTSIAARIGASSAKAANAAKKIKKAAAAIDAFVDTIEDFVNVLDKFKDLAKKLKGRGGGFAKKSRTRNTVALKKENKKKDKRCRLCKKDDHSTPRSLHGEIRYV